MITKQEIESKAIEFGIHHANVERDYVFGWLPCGIYASSGLRDYLSSKVEMRFEKPISPQPDFRTTWISQRSQRLIKSSCVRT